MISRHAVQKYLDAPHDNHNWLKDQPRSWFDEQLGPLPGKDPFLHQLACIYLGVKYPRFGFFLKMGLGKSKIVLDIIQYRMRRRPQLKTIIFVPYLINFDGWADQLQQHAPNLSATILSGSSTQRLSYLDQTDSSIYVINYSGFCHLISTKRTKKPSKNAKTTQKQKTELVVDMNKLQEFGSRFSVMVCDESTALKNHTTLTYKACLALSHLCPFRYLLTGTPFGKTPHDLWTQYMVLDHGETLGPTLGMFREAFFHNSPGFFGGYDHKFISKMKEPLTKKISHRSIFYTVEECLDLPPQIETPIHFDWGQEALAYYTQLKESYVSMRKSSGREVEIQNTFHRLRQITSGFLMHKDQEDKTVIRFADNPKLEGLLELLEQSDTEDKFVVFHFYIETGQLISERLTKEKYKHSRLWSGTKDKTGEYTKFVKNKSTKVLVVNETIGSKNLNLQAANYIIFFESPIDPITREQAEARCRRPGQTRPVFLYDFMMRGSVDEKIVKSVKAGRNLLHEVLAGTSDL